MLTGFRVPFLSYVMGGVGAAMLVPTVHGFQLGQNDVAATFGFDACLTLCLAVILALALGSAPKVRAGQHDLAALLACYLFIPAIAALPFGALVADMTYSGAYFEMLSALTTTGSTLFLDPSVLPEPLLIWRSLIGWLGGLLILVAALSIMEPLNIGGFEVRSTVLGIKSGEMSLIRAGVSSGRLMRNLEQIAPFYVAATFGLFILLFILGDPALVALCHAMAVMSTSGLSPTNGLETAPSAAVGEFAMVFFFMAALTHRLFPHQSRHTRLADLVHDPEFRTAMGLILLATIVLFLRHFSGAADVGGGGDLLASLQAAWGLFFTLLSFITTTGFASVYWDGAQAWSGLQSTGLVLLALAIVGGGIATTAGGIKLLRFFALQKHGRREMERLIHPSSVGGYGVAARRIRREGAFIAWIFVMIFLLTLALVFLALAASGLSFEEALVMAIASLSNCGPLAWHVIEDPIDIRAMSDTTKAILNVSMILGRMEVLAALALFNLEYWRR